MNYFRRLPFLEWLPTYTRTLFVSDLVAGVVVAVMLVPQSMAYALLAGLPPQMGLYAAMLPLALYGIFGTSRTLSVAPVAIDSLLTAAALGGLALGSESDYIAAAIGLAAMVGLLQLLMGVARLGFLVNFLSQPVLSGFTTGAAIVIGTSQLKHVLGVTVPNSEQWGAQVAKLAGQLTTAQPVTLALSAAAVTLLLYLRNILPTRLARTNLPAPVRAVLARPGPLLVVALGTLLVWGLRLDLGAEVRVVGAIPGGLPSLAVPTLPLQTGVELLPAALTIALIGYLEAISVGKSLASKRRQQIDPDRELIALGISNVGASVTGGFPVTGGLSRSVVNFSAGAQTGMASLISALFVALTTLFFTPLFTFLPNAILASIILVAVAPLFTPGTFLTLWRYSKADATAWLTTFVTVLAVNVQSGILAGAALSLLLFLYRTTRPHVAIVGRMGNSEIYRNVLRHEVYTCPHVLAVRVDESLYFPNTRFLEETVLRLVAQKVEIRHFVLIGTAINFIDASALDALEGLIVRLRDANVTFHLAAIKGPVMDRLERVGFPHLMGEGRIFLSTHDAMLALGCVEPANDAP